MQLNHYNSKFKTQEFPIVLITTNVIRPANIGSLFRLADAFGVKKLILGGTKIELNRKVWNTARATEKVVDFQQIDDLSALILNLKKENYSIVSLEITQHSQPITELDFSAGQKIALIVGSERYGIDSEILQLSDSIFHIEMFGQNTSMNVAQAASIALFKLTTAIQYAK